MTGADGADGAGVDGNDCVGVLFERVSPESLRLSRVLFQPLPLSLLPSFLELPLPRVSLR